MKYKYLNHLKPHNLLADIFLIIIFPITHICIVIGLLITKSDERVDSFKEANIISLKDFWFALKCYY